VKRRRSSQSWWDDAVEKLTVSQGHNPIEGHGLLAGDDGWHSRGGPRFRSSKNVPGRNPVMPLESDIGKVKALAAKRKAPDIGHSVHGIGEAGQGLAKSKMPIAMLTRL